MARGIDVWRCGGAEGYGQHVRVSGGWVGEGVMQQSKA